MLTLLTEGFSFTTVFAKTGVSKRTIYRLKKKAYKRGFRSTEDPYILEVYVKDSEKLDRLKTITEAIK